MNQLLFNSSYEVKLSVKQIVQEIVGFMALDTKRRYKITIGTDSERIPGNQADFVSAVVVHRVGNGGRYFWRRVELGKFNTLRDRIIKEVLLSLELAQEVLAELKKIKDISFDFEVHADIGENGETKAMIQEVVSMIRAYNFEPKTKPESYAASNVADRHV